MLLSINVTTLDFFELRHYVIVFKCHPEDCRLSNVLLIRYVYKIKYKIKTLTILA